MTRIAIIVAMVVGVLHLAVPASAQQISLRMAILGGVGQSGYGEAMTGVPDVMAKATNGRVKVEIFDSLIPATQLGNAIRDGRIDMIGGVHPFLSGEEPRFTIGHLPGLIRNAAEYKKVLDAYMADVITEAWAKRYNGTALAHGIWYEAPHFSNKPITKLSDFKGLKVRSHNAEAAQMLTAIGAQPTQIAPGEMAGALQRGVIDALSTEYGSAVSLGMQDAAKYMENWEFSVNLGWTVVMNTAVWEKLPNDVKTQIRTGMKAFQEDRFATYDANSEKKKQILLSKGMVLVDVPPEEQAKAFTDQNVQAIYAGWYDRAKTIGVDGPAIVARVRQILGK
ncbi:MAG: TRAP transporter substrate-binding protein DctP [Alphaproteobacteria bacterium]